LRLLLSFREDSTAIKGVIDYLSYSRSVWVHVHSITSAQMAQNALCRDLTGYSTQFRVTPGLNMVNPENSFVKR
jgi:hypothetical protein